MIDIVTRSFLGQWGQTLLDTYLKYSLWVNLFIMIYFLALLLSQRNYRHTLADLLDAIEKAFPNQLNKKTSQEIARLLTKKEIPWEAGLLSSRWPLIASPRHLIPRVKNVRTLKSLFPIDSLATLLDSRMGARSKKSQS